MKKKSILLIGIGRFGKHLAIKLNELGHEVMAVDSEEEKINEIVNIVTDAQIGDTTNEGFLKSLDIKSYDVCIVTISGDFQSSLETTCLLKDLGAKKVVSRAEKDRQANLLIRNGADEIIYPEKQLANWAAIRYSSDHIFDYIELDELNAIFEVSTPLDWVGKSIQEIDIRKKFKINILAIKENGKINSNVTPDLVLDENKNLLVLGEHKQVQKCFNI